MKKGFLKRLATESLAAKLLEINRNERYPSIVRGIAYFSYVLDIIIFYAFAPFALGGFAYLFLLRNNYIMFVFSLFLFVCACVLVFKKLTAYAQERRNAI